jgi:hypothetical protein
LLVLVDSKTWHQKWNTYDVDESAMIQMNIARGLSRRLRHADETLFRGLVTEMESIDESLSILTSRCVSKVVCGETISCQSSNLLEPR